ncbi:hypothetical protein OC842_006544 [Tilletia horrida]|uniref:Uncharacterized protein n=1 Tax=Tilletia horrida TaxID=155126 RepID=A0AAN6G809_9BASI|nr:hypothetical protein OC842_006544 [Tilletia horrida]
MTETVPTDLPSSTSDDTDSSSATSTSTETREPSSTTTTTTESRTTRTEDEPTTTRSTRTPDRESTSTAPPTTVFTTTSSLSLSVSGTQTFTQVVIVTIPAGVPNTPASDRSSSSSSSGTIGGIVGGVVGGLALLAFILAALFTYKRRKDRTGHGWFLCFGRRPGRRGSAGAGSEDGWPTFDPTANTNTSAAGSMHRDPFSGQDRSAQATLPNLVDETEDLENPGMVEYGHGGGSGYGSYGPSAAAAAAGAAAAGAYYARSPTQQSFYPQSSHPSQNSHGGALGMYAAGPGPDDVAAQQAYAYNVGRAVSPGPNGAGGGPTLSQHSHGAESFGNDYSHLDPPDVRAQREAEAAAAAAGAAAGAGGAAGYSGAGYNMPHSRKSSQASAFGMSPFLASIPLGGPSGSGPGTGAAPAPAPGSAASPPPPSYSNLRPESPTMGADGGNLARRAATPPLSRLPIVRDAGEDGLDVAAAERAVPGAPGANRLQLSNPDTDTHI